MSKEPLLSSQVALKIARHIKGNNSDYYSTEQGLTELESIISRHFVAIATAGTQDSMPRRYCDVHQREEFKYESLEHELCARKAQCDKCGCEYVQVSKVFTVNLDCDCDCHKHPVMDFTEQAERAAQKIIDECYFEKVDQPYIRKRFAYLILSEFGLSTVQPPTEIKCDCKHEIEAANCPRFQECASQPTAATFTEQARQLVKQIQSVIVFTATTSSLFASHRNVEEGDYFRCLRCGGESLHGSQRATGNVAHKDNCPVALANRLWNENAVASGFAEAATQGQVAGIERAVEILNAGRLLALPEAPEIAETLEKAAAAIRALSPDPYYLDRVRNEAATAALEQAAQWQPIETAPKDGTQILLGHGNSLWIDEWIPDAKYEVRNGEGGCWMMCDQWTDPEIPSHWQPLPPLLIAAIGDDKE